MKIRVLARDASRYENQLVGQRKFLLRNHDARAHPMAAAQEYQRALTAAKMERIFAKPFVHSFEGHLDTVQCIARCNRSVYDFFSGSCDGELRYWNLPSKSCARAVLKAHEGFITGICVNLEDKYVLTCGRDSAVKQWAVQKNFRADLVMEDDVEDAGNRVEHTLASSDNLNMRIGRQVVPVSSYLACSPLTGVDYHDEREWFCSSGETVCVWDINRSSPLVEGGRGEGGDVINDTYTFIKWSPSETHLLLAGNANDSIGLFDSRQAMSLPVQKVTALRARSNACCWNPMRPFEFAVANDDGNIYTFDVRNLEAPRTTHSGFVNAALCVDYSPTGTEFVAGSYDKTLRIWEVHRNRSREVYFNKRMQMVTAVRYTGDAQYILSGSADFNIRVWKAQAHDKAHELKSRREREVHEYRDALKEKFKVMPEVGRILQQRQVPKYLHNATRRIKISKDAQVRKQKRIEEHRNRGKKNQEEPAASEGEDDALDIEERERAELSGTSTEDESEDGSGAEQGGKANN